MLISEAWLREYIDPDIDTLDLAHQMTMAGLEVEAVNVLSGDFENVVVAEIISVVTNGIGVMPPWEGILTKEEIEAVAYYIFMSTNK